MRVSRPDLQNTDCYVCFLNTGLARRENCTMQSLCFACIARLAGDEPPEGTAVRIFDKAWHGHSPCLACDRRTWCKLLSVCAECLVLGRLQSSGTEQPPPYVAPTTGSAATTDASSATPAPAPPPRTIPPTASPGFGGGPPPSRSVPRPGDTPPFRFPGFGAPTADSDRMVLDAPIGGAPSMCVRGPAERSFPPPDRGSGGSRGESMF